MTAPPFLRPFWRYYGGKWRAAPRYPKPLHDTIVEPFAGAAGYSMRHYQRNVILVEKYAVVAEIWRYLIGASAAEIRAIPSDIEHVDELPDGLPQGARWLVGFTMNAATVAPCKQLSSGRKKLRAAGCKHEGWSEGMRERVASQVEHIRHRRVIEAGYDATPDIEATWYIDPPYQRAGIHYKHPSTAIDFPALGQWCRSRRGQVIVCEAAGADWLPFRPFASIKSFGAGGKIRTSVEVIWTNDECAHPMVRSLSPDGACVLCRSI